MILTVDDFGFHAEANERVIQAIKTDFVTHVSTIVNLPGSAEALEFLGSYRRQRGPEAPGVVFGLHLNLSEGQPISSVDTVKSLVDTNGQFLGWEQLLKRAVFGHVVRDHIQRETDRQITLLKSNGAQYLFFNSHHHVHLWPSIARAVSPVLKHHGIRFVRQPQHIWWPAIAERYGLKAIAIQSLAATHRPILEPMAQRLVDFDWVDPSDHSREQAIRRVPQDAELSCHPHLYTTSAETRLTEKPIPSLTWLMAHQSLLPHKNHSGR